MSIHRPSGLLVLFAVAAVLAPVGPASGASGAGSVVLSRLERWSLAADGARGRLLRLRVRGEGPWPVELSSFSPHWADGVLRLRELRARDAGGTQVVLTVTPVPGGGLRLQAPEGRGSVTATVEVEERAPPGAAGILSFSPSHVFEAPWSVQTDVVEVETEGARDLTFVARRMGSAGEPRIERRPGWTRWVWTLSDLTPPAPELRALPRAFRAPTVRASVLGTWEPVAGWLAPLLKRATAPDDTVRRLAARLALEEPTAAGRVRAVHRLVASTVRHADLDVGVALDLGGHPAGEVLRRGFGDCVDRAVATTALLRCLGVECRPMFLCTRRYRPFDPEVPTLIPGDHCVVRCVVDGESLVLDPGARWHDYPMLPAEDQDVVAFEPETGSFFRTPDTTAGDHGVVVRQEVDLTPEGNLEGSFLLEPRGEEAARLRGVLSRGKGLDAVVEEAVGLPAGSLLTWRRAGPSADIHAPLRIEGAYRVARAVMRADDVGVLVVPGHGHGAVEVAAPVRELDLAYPHATRRVVSTRLRLPPGCRLDPLPPTFEASAPGVWARVDVKMGGGVVEIEDAYERRVRTLPVSEYPAFKRLLELRAANGARGLVLSGWRASPGEGARRLRAGPGPGPAPAAVLPARTVLREVVVDLREPTRRRVVRHEVVDVFAGAEPGVADLDLVLPASARLVSMEGETRVAGGGGVRPVPRSAMVRSVVEGKVRVSFPGVEPGARCSVRLEYVEELPSPGPIPLAGPLAADLVRVQVLGGASPVTAVLLGAGLEGTACRQSRVGALTSWTAELRGLGSREGPTLATAPGRRPPGPVLDLATGVVRRVGESEEGKGLRCRDEVRAEVRGSDLVASLERRYAGPGAASLGRALAAGGAAAGRRIRSVLSGALPGAAVDEVSVGWDHAGDEPVLSARLTLPGAVRRLGDGRLAVSLPVVPVEGGARLSALSRRVRLVGPVGTTLQAFGGQGGGPGIFERFTAVDDRSIVWEEERVAAAGGVGVSPDGGQWPLALLMVKDGR